MISFLLDVESIIENPCMAISAPAILKKIEESKHFPCYLVPLPGETDKKFNLKYVHILFSLLDLNTMPSGNTILISC